MARYARYELSQEKQDFCREIPHYTKAIFLPPVSPVGHSLNFVQILFRLVLADLKRTEKFEQPEYIGYPIIYDFPGEPPWFPRCPQRYHHDVTYSNTGCSG